MDQVAPRPTPRHKPAPHGELRNDYLANIHANARKLGYDCKDDRRDYETVLDLLIGMDSCTYASFEQLQLVDRVFAAKFNNRTITEVKFTPLARAVGAATDEEVQA